MGIVQLSNPMMHLSTGYCHVIRLPLGKMIAGVDKTQEQGALLPENDKKTLGIMTLL